MYVWTHYMRMRDVRMWMRCVRGWMCCVQCEWKKKKKMRLVVICAHRDNTYLVRALSVNAWTCGIGDGWDAKGRKGGGERQKWAWRELGLRKFCACLRSHNALHTNHARYTVCLYKYRISLSFFLSLAHSLSPPPPPPPPRVRVNGHHHSTRRQTPTVGFFFFLLLFLLCIRSADSRHNHRCVRRRRPPPPPFVRPRLPPHPRKFLFYLFFFTSLYICSVDDHHHHPSASMATNTTESARTRHVAGKHYFTMYSVVLTLFSLSLFVPHPHNNASPTHHTSAPTHVNHRHLPPIDKSRKFFFCFFFFSLILLQSRRLPPASASLPRWQPAQISLLLFSFSSPHPQCWWSPLPHFSHFSV